MNYTRLTSLRKKIILVVIEASLSKMDYLVVITNLLPAIPVMIH